MPVTREFVFETRDIAGLCPWGMANADPGSGRTVAHDILEHFSFAGDPVQNELLALGALYLLRFESGAQLTSTTRSLAELLATSVFEVLSDLMNDHSLQPPRSRRVPNRQALPEHVVTQAVDLAYQRLDEAAEREADEWCEPRRALLHTHKAAVTAWVLAGYQQATLRYRNTDVYTVGSTVFDDIARQSQALIDSGLLSEGDRVRVSVDAQQGAVNLRVNPLGSARWLPSRHFV